MVTEQQILDFIAAQPNSKRVNMKECLKGEECGCIGAQYCKSIGFDFDSIGNNRAYSKDDEIEFEKNFYEFSPKGYSFKGSYREVKQFLKEKGKL